LGVARRKGEGGKREGGSRKKKIEIKRLGTDGRRQMHEEMMPAIISLESSVGDERFCAKYLHGAGVNEGKVFL